MELHTEPAFDLDDPGDIAAAQVIASLRRVGDSQADKGALVRDAIGDERLDQFWRRRSVDGHC